MILAKPYLTLTGAQKRAAFENAHSKTHTYSVVRFLDGERDTSQYCASRKRYTWRIEKTKRAKTSK